MNTSKLLLKMIIMGIMLISLFSCHTQNSESVILLQQAQNIMEENPQEALTLLDSINDPAAMDEEHYMEYIVAHVQAKYKTYADITNDTLIFKALTYFEKRSDPYKKAVANFYTGGLYREREEYDKTLQYFLYSRQYAREAKDSLFISRSAQNIADLYFDKNMMDSALVSYHEALKYFDNSARDTKHKLIVYNYIGLSYEDTKKYDSAFVYFHKGLELAKKLNDKQSEGWLINNLGLVYTDIKDYPKAIEHYHQSLSITVRAEDSLRTHVNLLKLFNTINNTDSATYYTNIVKDELSASNNIYIKRVMYTTLYDYFKNRENYEKALYYNDLKEKTNQEIIKADSSEKLLCIEKEHQLSIKEKELSETRTRQALYLSIFIFVIILILLINYFRNRNIHQQHRLETERNKYLQAQYEQKAMSFDFLQKIYRNITNKWATIDQEVELLAAEYGVSEKPSLYMQIKKLIDNLQHDTNQYLIEWTENHLNQEPYKSKMVTKKMKKADILFLGFCCYGYSKVEIAHILGIPKQKVYPKILSLKHQLLDMGLSPEEAEKLLFQNSTITEK